MATPFTNLPAMDEGSSFFINSPKLAIMIFKKLL